MASLLACCRLARTKDLFSINPALAKAGGNAPCFLRDNTHQGVREAADSRKYAQEKQSRPAHETFQVLENRRQQTEISYSRMIKFHIFVEKKLQLKKLTSPASKNPKSNARDLENQDEHDEDVERELNKLYPAGKVTTLRW